MLAGASLDEKKQYKLLSSTSAYTYTKGTSFADGIDDAFAACAAAAAAAAGVGLLAATRTDAYACPTTGRHARTYRVVIASGRRACSKHRSSVVALEITRCAHEGLRFVPRSYANEGGGPDD